MTTIEKNRARLQKLYPNDISEITPEHVDIARAVCLHLADEIEEAHPLPSASDTRTIAELRAAWEALQRLPNLPVTLTSYAQSPQDDGPARP